MVKVKTFGEPLQPLKTHREMEEIDHKVNSFIAENNVREVVSLHDLPITDDNGATIGFLRTLLYKD